MLFLVVGSICLHVHLELWCRGGWNHIIESYRCIRIFLIFNLCHNLLLAASPRDALNQHNGICAFLLAV